MNRIDESLRAELRSPLFQTWNPHVEPKPDTVKADYEFERPVVTLESVAAMGELAKVQGKGHVWLVGAYSLNSMPLLENGVKSAIDVAARLGVDCSDVAFDEARAAAAQRKNGSRGMLLGAVVATVALAAVLRASRA